MAEGCINKQNKIRLQFVNSIISNIIMIFLETTGPFFWGTSCTQSMEHYHPQSQIKMKEQTIPLLNLLPENNTLKKIRMPMCQ